MFNMQNLGILKINEQAGKIPNCIRFDKGSGRFNFPDEFLPMVEDLKEKIKGRYFHYPKASGEDTLKEQIVKFENQNGRKVELDNITITNGGMSGLFNFFYLATKAGDEIITNQYCFEGFSLLIEHFQLVQKRVDLSSKQDIEKSINTKTKAIILNSPENPTGKVYPREEIDNITNIARRKNLWVLSDEVMNRIIYSNIKWYGPPLDYDKVVIINSFSKNWFIPGIRLGWIATKNHKMTNELNNLFSLRSVGVNLLGQLLMAEILERLDYTTFITEKLNILEKRKSFFEKSLNENNLHHLHKVEGGMNFYINLRDDSQKIAEKLLHDCSIAIIPGYIFEGTPSMFARFGFGAVNERNIKKGIRALASLLEDYK